VTDTQHIVRGHSGQHIAHSEQQIGKTQRTGTTTTQESTVLNAAQESSEKESTALGVRSAQHTTKESTAQDYTVQRDTAQESKAQKSAAH
jgi:hypothetical protein